MMPSFDKNDTLASIIESIEYALLGWPPPSGLDLAFCLVIRHSPTFSSLISLPIMLCVHLLLETPTHIYQQF